MADFLVLDNRQKQMYDVILSAVQRGDTRITLDYIGDMGVVMEIVKIVLADFPELFYYDNCSIRYTFSNKGIILLLSKWVSESSVAVMNKALKTRVAEIVSSCIPAGMTEGQKALSLYRYMVNNIRYAENYSGQRPLPQLHTAYGAIVESNAVCEGIAAAYNLLLKAVNISATTVNGYAEYDLNSSHSWNIIKLCDEYYHVDVTWALNNCKADLNSMDYFALTDEDLSQRKWNRSIFHACKGRQMNFFAATRSIAHSDDEFINIALRQIKRNGALYIKYEKIRLFNNENDAFSYIQHLILEDQSLSSYIRTGLSGVINLDQSTVLMKPV